MVSLDCRTRTGAAPDDDLRRKHRADARVRHPILQGSRAAAEIAAASSTLWRSKRAPSGLGGPPPPRRTGELRRAAPGPWLLVGIADVALVIDGAPRHIPDPHQHPAPEGRSGRGD